MYEQEPSHYLVEIPLDELTKNNNDLLSNLNMSGSDEGVSLLSKGVVGTHMGSDKKNLEWYYLSNQSGNPPFRF